MRRFNSTLLIVLSILMTTLRLKAQKQGEGSITGNILENGSLKPIQGATIALIPLTGPSTGQSMATIATLNVADPFIQQEYTSHTHAPNFNVDAWSASRTRNYRLTLSYDWNRTIEKGRKQLLKAAHKNDL